MCKDVLYKPSPKWIVKGSPLTSNPFSATGDRQGASLDFQSGSDDMCVRTDEKRSFSFPAGFSARERRMPREEKPEKLVEMP